MNADNSFYKDLAQLIRFHRKQSRLNQQELAELAGVGKTAVFDIEHGKSTIQINTLLNILHALNITCEFKSPLMQVYRAQYEKSENICK